MKQLPLNQGKFTLIDDEDYERVSQYKWVAYRSGKQRNRWYVKRLFLINGVRRTVSLHRFIMNAPKGMTVDHINNDGLDNRKQNLRICTTRQNTQNMRRWRKHSTGFKGVRLHWKRYQARIRINGISICIGVFNTPEEAAMAYDAVAITFFGEFAHINFPGKAA